MKVTHQDIFDIENKLTNLVQEIYSLRHRLRLYGYENTVENTDENRNNNWINDKIDKSAKEYFGGLAK
jgi:hypothetical protein